ncbi:MAG: antitoxin [Erysipelotrichaceae bacterium]|nr:antitoxin [Erysipelotrichaceae bacterium]
MTMRAKLFENGRSQAVRLPKEYRFEGDEVRINKIGDIVILVPIKSKWDNFMKAVDMFSDDFLSDGRAEQIADRREEL